MANSFPGILNSTNPSKLLYAFFHLSSFSSCFLLQRKPWPSTHFPELHNWHHPQNFPFYFRRVDVFYWFSLLNVSCLHYFLSIHTITDLIRPTSPPKCAFAIVRTSFPTSEGLETQHQPQDLIRGWDLMRGPGYISTESFPQKNTQSKAMEMLWGREAEKENEDVQTARPRAGGRIHEREPKNPRQKDLGHSVHSQRNPTWVWSFLLSENVSLCSTDQWITGSEHSSCSPPPTG